ncbi:peptide-methionine (S)-S-oxide reductase MsrA [Haloglycomyces albus]|uniref:peptide-methionine (S)-S-oxide reductase MsrA n=1 Tax=Haloglycomyces albus TaxID=526067 RepID=UPI00046D1F17|nr:peptide-methionine (S)-S-oxide reductase MsrA [Haloglycomyces albus]
MTIEHAVLHTPIDGPVPEGKEVAYFGMGCFWGAERMLWSTDGVWTTAVGYMGGDRKNPTYGEVCSGTTGHAEAVKVVYDPSIVSYAELLRLFWENHDPTQGHRQGNDVGSQYRSVIFTTTDEQQQQATSSREAFQPTVTEAGYGPITTYIDTAGDFWLAEDYHQQYLHKNPLGYDACGSGICTIQW